MTTPGFERILVPTDFSACAETAWGVAKRLGGALGSELRLLHVLVEAAPFSEGPFTMSRAREFYAEIREWSEHQLARWADAARGSGLVVETELRAGTPFQEIAAVAEEGGSSLIVMGTHGRGGLSRALLGSVTDRVIRVAPCPVLSVREGD